MTTESSVSRRSVQNEVNTVREGFESVVATDDAAACDISEGALESTSSIAGDAVRHTTNVVFECIIEGTIDLVGAGVENVDKYNPYNASESDVAEYRMKWLLYGIQADAVVLYCPLPEGITLLHDNSPIMHHRRNEEERQQSIRASKKKRKRYDGILRMKNSVRLFGKINLCIFYTCLRGN